jgi:hypothetical protein
MNVRRCRAVGGAVLAAALWIAGCQAPAAPVPAGVEVYRGRLLDEDCVAFGYARTTVVHDFTSACSLDGGDTAGPVINATAWFNCRLETQEVWARGLQWSECTNGAVNEKGTDAHMVTAFGCMGPDGIATPPCLMSPLPDTSLEVSGNSAEGFLLRALNLRLTTVLQQVMQEGGPSLEDRLLLIKTADLFGELADAGFALGSPVSSVGAVDAAHRLLDLATDFTPGVSLLKSAAIVITGRNPVTGEMVSDFERAFTLAAMVVPSFLSGGARELVGTARALEHVGESPRPLRGLANELVGSLERGEADMAELVADLPCPGVARAAPGPRPTPRWGGGLLALPEDPAGSALEAPCVRALGAVAAEVAERGRENLEALRAGKVGFGEAPRLDYAKTYRQHYATYNDQIGQVHHAVEQQVLQLYPGVVTESEMNSLPNLRGMPLGDAGNQLHQGTLRAEWDAFYLRMEQEGRAPTKDELLQEARILDDKYGSQFVPPIR